MTHQHEESHAELNFCLRRRWRRFDEARYQRAVREGHANGM